jgi:hypothetical protein
MPKIRLGVLFSIALAFGPSKALFAEIFQPQLINGQPAAAGTLLEVVRISILAPDGVVEGSCTGTVVGPAVIATAAHCVETNQRVRFTYKGVRYAGKGYQSPLFETKGHDLAVILADTKIADAKPIPLTFARLASDERVLLAGYGCTQKGGTGGNDGILRTGTATVGGPTSGYDYWMVAGTSGAAVCFGDSGGPTFRQTAGLPLRLAGIISSGDIQEFTLSVRHDLQESKDFYQSVERIYKTQICGLSAPGC